MSLNLNNTCSSNCLVDQKVKLCGCPEGCKPKIVSWDVPVTNGTVTPACFCNIQLTNETPAPGSPSIAEVLGLVPEPDAQITFRLTAQCGCIFSSIQVTPIVSDFNSVTLIRTIGGVAFPGSLNNSVIIDTSVFGNLSGFTITAVLCCSKCNCF